MTITEIISGLKFTIEMFLFDPNTGEKLTEPRNDMDKITLDACKGAIKALEQQPCEDCVSRKLLSDNLCEGISCNECSFNEIDGESGCLLQKRFDELPSVQPTRPTGRWIEKEDYNLDTYYDCSECGESFCLIDGTPADNLYKYCPNCGARMAESEG
jgi:DNA-directed RNA polymerase subunit RPC12/RpoP